MPVSCAPSGGATPFAGPTTTPRSSITTRAGPPALVGAGPLVDRWGARWPLVVGFLILGGTFIALASVTGLGQFYVLQVTGRAVHMGVLSVGSGVLWGRMSDHIGRAQTFLYSFIIQAAAFALLSLVPGMGSFVTASILMGITLRATYTVCAASSGDYVPVRFSAAAFALMSVGASLGSTISPTLGGAVADNLDMRWTFALALCGSFAGTAGALFLQTRKPLSESVQPCPDP